MATRWNNRSRTRTSTPEHKASRLRVLARDNYTCQIRGPHCTLTGVIKDHIIPVAEGGDDSDSNGQAACRNCNQWKAQQEAARGQQRRRARLQLPPEPHPGQL